MAMQQQYVGPTNAANKTQGDTLQGDVSATLHKATLHKATNAASSLLVRTWCRRGPHHLIQRRIRVIAFVGWYCHRRAISNHSVRVWASAHLLGGGDPLSKQPGEAPY